MDSRRTARKLSNSCVIPLLKKTSRICCLGTPFLFDVCLFVCLFDLPLLTCDCSPVAALGVVLLDLALPAYDFPPVAALGVVKVLVAPVLVALVWHAGWLNC